VLRPCIPHEWPGFTVRHRLPDGRTTYEVVVTRGQAMRASLDGADVPLAGREVRVPLARDGGAHRVEVVLGPDAAPVYAPAG
jgi:cyclic beta-1,2-glucan synthetase